MKKKNMLGKKKNKHTFLMYIINKKHLLFSLIIGFFIIFIDQLTKYFARDITNTIDFIIFKLNFVKNRGVAFGFLFGGSFFIIFIILLILLLSFIYLISLYNKIKNEDKTEKKKLFEFYLIVFIFWSATSNLIDRFFFGFVTDFIDFGFFPIFNFADIIISISIILLLFHYLLNSK